MQKLTHNTSTDKQLKYHGNSSQFVLLFLKNLVLNLLTIGLYYPWGRVEILKFHSSATVLKDDNFNFNGNAKEVFNSFIMVYLIFIICYSLLLIATLNPGTTIQIYLLMFSYLTFIIIFPFVLHGILKYRCDKTTWKGIQFTYLGIKSELFWKFITGLLITFLTLGIYGPWFLTELRKYIISHLRFGNLSFEFQGDGAKLFWIQLKFVILMPLTLGIYSFWYIKELLEFYIDNVVVNQNETKTNLKLTVHIGDIFRLFIVNFVLFIFSFGLATPWIIIRTYRRLIPFIEIDKKVIINDIQQTSYKVKTDQSFLNLKLV